MEKKFHMYKDFFDEAILQGWTMIKQYEVSILETSIPKVFRSSNTHSSIKFQLWATPKSDNLYIVQIWPNDLIFIFEHIDNFKFNTDGKNAPNKA